MILAPAQSGMAFIACREAYVATTYMDSHAPANGFGQNDPTLQPGQVTTMEAAIGRFRDYCAYLTGEISKLVRPDIQPRIVQHEADAIVSLAYNIGPHGSYKDRPGGGLAYQSNLLDQLELYLEADQLDAQKRALLRDLVGKEITQANEDPITGRPFNATRRWREAVLFGSGDYGDVLTLKSWGPGKDPKKDSPDLVPMPKFVP